MVTMVTPVKITIVLVIMVTILEDIELVPFYQFLVPFY